MKYPKNRLKLRKIIEDIIMESYDPFTDIVKFIHNNYRRRVYGSK